MRRIITAVLAPRSAAVLLALAAAVLAPRPADAQCTGCISTGGQPGGDGRVECLDQPEGGTDCRTGQRQVMRGAGYGWAWVDWCETSGECQGLMFLDFSEDGTPVQFLDGIQIPDGTPRGWNNEGRAETGKTCDGILLRPRAIRHDVARHETTLALVL